ncbi:MAG: hypothetical protein IT460_10505 [Planctomycetes bacterium]|nr:hypothetical protein [Planctomycetota bacterium]
MRPRALALVAALVVTLLPVTASRGRAADAPGAGAGTAPTPDDDLARLTSSALSPRVVGTAPHAAARAFLAERLAALAGAPATAATFPLGVADLRSPRDLVLTTPKGPVVLRDAFRPWAGSPTRAAGTPVPLADGRGAVPLPGRLPDTSPEGVTRFLRQVEDGTAPAILLAPSPGARAAIAPFLDVPSSLTAASRAARDADASALCSPEALAPWIASRRAALAPDDGPLRVPVLVLEDDAYEALDREKPTAIDFAVAWDAVGDALAQGRGGENLVAVVTRPDATGAPAVVVVAVPYDDAPGPDRTSAGVAAALAALRAYASAVRDGTAACGLLVALLDGGTFGARGARALLPTLRDAYDVKALVTVGPAGPLGALGVPTEEVPVAPAADAAAARATRDDVVARVGRALRGK